MQWTTGRGRSSRGSLTMLCLLFMLASTATAQLSGLSGLKSSVSFGGDQTSETPTKATETPTAKKTTDGSSQTTPAAKTTAKTQGTTVKSADVSLTGGISMSSSSTSSPASKQTGPSSIFHLSDLPTVAGATDPTQVVPYTAAAPFMQKSNLPEGTVFIIVGAILGAFGLCVLLWRAAVAWSLARSVKRAALTQHQTFDLKSAAYPAPSGGVYGASNASVERLSAVFPAKTAKRKSHVGTGSSTNLSTVPPYAASARASQQNLFFSPTAGAGHPSANPSPNMPGNRGSSYLPAGYYAAGNSQPAGGAPTTHVNAHAAGARGSSILNPLSDRLSGIRAENLGYQRAQSFGPSPPGSPGLPASGAVSRSMTPGNASSVVGNVGAGFYGQQSQSSLNLSVPGGAANGGRTPSAYLEDLFENHGNGPRERF